MADTRGAAHALARHGGGVAAPGAMLAALAPLPIAALRIDSETAEALARLGLRRIGDLTPLPRAPLARRFGAGLMLRLDQALGVQPEPIAPDPEPLHYGVRLTLPEPIGLVSDVQAGLTRLLDGSAPRWPPTTTARASSGSRCAGWTATRCRPRSAWPVR